MSFIANDFTRQGAINLAVYLPDGAGATIAAPVAPTVTAYTFTLTEALVTNGRRFNLGYSTPGAQRTIKTLYASYDEDGRMTWTAASTGVNITPNAANNGCIVRQTGIPAKAIFVIVLVDDQIANIIQTPPASRRNGTASLELAIPVLYEPNATSLTLSDLNDSRSSKAVKEFRRYSLGDTTGALTHTIELSKIDIPVNDLPNEVITTRSKQMISGTFKGPKSKLQALFTGGTAYIGCSNSCAINDITQLGWRSGSCDDNRVYELTFPGDSCYNQLDALLVAKATHGDASQAVEYSSDAASHLPVTLSQAASGLFKGQHDLTLLKI